MLSETTTPCPICEADADVLPIPDFDSEAFHDDPQAKKASWIGKERSSAPTPEPAAAAGPASRITTSFESCGRRERAVAHMQGQRGPANTTSIQNDSRLPQGPAGASVAA
jgi:hypothetical protein